MTGRRPLLALAVVVSAHAGAEPTPAPPPPRSAVFDHAAAKAQRDRVDYAGVIVVEGVDDERPRKPPPPLEQRFAAVLTATRPPADPRRLAAVLPQSTPCVTLPSTIVPVGGSFNAHGYCP